MIKRRNLLIGIAISFVLLMTVGFVKDVTADANGCIRVNVYETCWMGDQNCGSRSFTEWDYVYPDPHTKTVPVFPGLPDNHPLSKETKEVHDDSHGWNGVVGERRESRPRKAIWSCDECWSSS